MEQSNFKIKKKMVGAVKEIQKQIDFIANNDLNLVSKIELIYFEIMGFFMLFGNHLINLVRF